MAGGSFGGGSGTLADPYLVEDDLDLNAIRTIPNIGAYFKLVANIDTSVNYSAGWTPLASSGQTSNFYSSIDGGNYTISNLKAPLINTNLGVHENIKIHANITTGSWGGAFCQFNVSNGRFKNCHASGNVFGSASAGGFISWQDTPNSGTKILEYCSSSADVHSNSSAGGLVGQMRRNIGSISDTICYIDDCICTGEVSGGNNVGGIVGYIYERRMYIRRMYIRRCIATGNVSGLSYTGGILGQVLLGYGYVEECVALMSSITRSSGTAITFGRISGEAPDGNRLTHQNCRALDTMVFVP